MNWLWINIPLMAAFFLAMTGIPLWLVFRHPDRGPAVSNASLAVSNTGLAVSNTGLAPERQSQAQPQSVAARYAASRAQTEPLAAIRLTVAGGDELVVPAPPRARR